DQRLGEHEYVIEFFLGENNLYGFLMGKDYLDYVVLPLEIDFIANISELLASLKQRNFNTYSSLAFSVYNKLLSPVLQKLQLNGNDPNNLVVIPDGILGYIPFEVLIQSKPAEGSSYKDLNYLINNYQISYHYSVKLFLLDRKVVDHKEHGPFLGFAPAFIDKVSPQYLALNERTRAFIDTLTAIPDAEKEVSSIAKLLKGRAQLGIAATEHNFKQLAGNYKILHLASHSIIEDEEPMYSKLLFDNEQDSIEDGFLHTYELYNMDLNADLVTLSSCNTGVGKLYKGEGIISLARGFMYAGVPNLVMSLWSVSDKPTKDLMTYFYEELKNGETKSAALRKAKLRYLEQADNYTSNPYYWSSFIYLGQVEKEKGLQNKYIWLSFLGLFAVLSLALIWNRRKRTAN
ncbi:MAG: CHAT domain-containing protein, partial [Cyclobacteriaceae bacterium]